MTEVNGFSRSQLIGDVSRTRLDQFSRKNLDHLSIDATHKQSSELLSLETSQGRSSNKVLFWNSHRRPVGRQMPKSLAYREAELEREKHFFVCCLMLSPKYFFWSLTATTWGTGSRSRLFEHYADSINIQIEVNLWWKFDLLVSWEKLRL